MLCLNLKRGVNFSARAEFDISLEAFEFMSSAI
jgi:hypothetical protein